MHQKGIIVGKQKDGAPIDSDHISAGASNLDFRKKRTEQSRWQDAFGNGGVF